jgi:eukaryotic-like serine/threonine-protein kinase
MTTVMLGSAESEWQPPRTASCAACGELWPAALATCPTDGGRLRLSELAPTASLEIGARVGDYVVAGKLEDGGMSTVYAAMHPLIGKRVAIKVISPDLSMSTQAIHQFVQEARTVNQIRHPNIIDIFTFGTLPDGRCYFVMEWLQGETLASALASGTLSFIDKVAIAKQVCDALDAAHASGVVHCDLKPENVFLVRMDEERILVKLLDFGIAKLTTPGDGPIDSTTATGATMGTPQYLSPEQARGEALDHRTDAYSLGVVLYEAFVGRLPFVADNVLDLVTMHVEHVPPDPQELCPRIPPALADLLLAMLEKYPPRRPSLAEVRDGLDSVCVSMMASPPKPEAVVIHPRPEIARRREGRPIATPLALSAGAAVLLFLAVTARIERRLPMPRVTAPPAPLAAPVLPMPASAPVTMPSVAAAPILSTPPTPASRARKPSASTRAPTRAVWPAPAHDVDDFRLVDPFAGGTR